MYVEGKILTIPFEEVEKTIQDYLKNGWRLFHRKRTEKGIWLHFRRNLDEP